ncbi:hypothetical protein [Terribacillus sp. 7520-G]|uniref:hypothetical protein n=1 Tax=Terribacillus TaxID=459532 RepID=UPI000BA5556E|nr:hypothetical protein [Terribacillus sp. 7520-G]PAD40381.1 hypothetical protein CHH53_00035 [Terribacillus sp. 7520-G]
MKKETMLIGTFIVFLGIAVSAFFYVQNKSVTSNSLKANEQKEQSYAAKAKVTEEPKELKAEHIEGEFALQKEMITDEEKEAAGPEPEVQEEEVLTTEEPVIAEDDTEEVDGSDSTYQAPAPSYTAPVGGSSGSSPSYSGSSGSSGSYSGGGTSGSRGSSGSSSGSNGSSKEPEEEKSADPATAPPEEKEGPAAKPDTTPKPAEDEPDEETVQEQEPAPEPEPDVPAGDDEEIQAVG